MSSTERSLNISVPNVPLWFHHSIIYIKIKTSIERSFRLGNSALINMNEMHEMHEMRVL